MKIKEALSKRQLGETVSSKSIQMLEQTQETLLYWILDNHNTIEEVLKAIDWTIDLSDDYY